MLQAATYALIAARRQMFACESTSFEEELPRKPKVVFEVYWDIRNPLQASLNLCVGEKFFWLYVLTYSEPYAPGCYWGNAVPNITYSGIVLSLYHWAHWSVRRFSSPPPLALQS